MKPNKWKKFEKVAAAIHRSEGRTVVDTVDDEQEIPALILGALNALETVIEIEPMNKGLQFNRLFRSLAGCRPLVFLSVLSPDRPAPQLSPIVELAQLQQNLQGIILGAN
jgi:hypothetical protein